jgi:6-phosphogluconolactonase (cycloisomerase 2 family)
MRTGLLSLLCILSLIATTMSYAIPFNIVPTVGTTLPTTVVAGSSVPAFYTVTNMTQSSRSNNYIKYLPPNVTQTTGAGLVAGNGINLCGTSFNLAAAGQAGSSCTLILTISGAVNGSDPDPQHHLFVCFPGGKACAGTNYPLNVSQSASSKLPGSLAISPFAYSSVVIGRTSTAAITLTGSSGIANVPVTIVSNNPGVVTVSPSSCTLSTTSNSCTVTLTGVSAGTATFSATAPGYSTLTSGVLTVNAGFAYVTSATPAQISYCNLNSTTGAFLTCNTSTGGATFNQPQGIALNPTNTGFYMLDQGITTNSLYYCSINNDGSVGTCQTTGGSGFTAGRFVKVNPTGTFAYINNGTSVFYCPINGDGSVGTCNTTGAFVGTSDIAFNPAGTISYVTTGGSTTYYCSVNVNGSFSSCATTGAGFTLTEGVAVNPAGTYAYIADRGIPAAWACSINQTTGAFTLCAATGTGTNSPDHAFGIAVDPTGAYAYVANYNDNAVTLCSISAVNGTLSNCTNTNPSAIALPFGIAVN